MAGTNQRTKNLIRPSKMKQHQQKNTMSNIDPKIKQQVKIMIIMINIGITKSQLIWL